MVKSEMVEADKPNINPSIAKIPLSQGQFALVEFCDISIVSTKKWYAAWQPNTRSYRAVSTSRPRIYMSVFLMKPNNGMVVDHINHDTLDNRRSNLRVVTIAENNANKKGAYRNSLSGIRGVSWYKNSNKWVSKISVGGKTIFLGYFFDKKYALSAYAVARGKYFGTY